MTPGPGVLISYSVTENGSVLGIFTNGLLRPVGQIRLARFVEQKGLQRQGQYLLAASATSARAIEGNPGDKGFGFVIEGVLERLKFKPEPSRVERRQPVRGLLAHESTCPNKSTSNGRQPCMPPALIAFIKRFA